MYDYLSDTISQVFFPPSIDRTHCTWKSWPTSLHWAKLQSHKVIKWCLGVYFVLSSRNSCCRLLHVWHCCYIPRRYKAHIFWFLFVKQSILLCSRMHQRQSLAPGLWKNNSLAAIRKALAIPPRTQDYVPNHPLPWRIFQLQREVIEWAHCNNAPASFLFGANAALNFWNMITSPRCVDLYALTSISSSTLSNFWSMSKVLTK